MNKKRFRDSVFIYLGLPPTMISTMLLLGGATPKPGYELAHWLMFIIALIILSVGIVDVIYSNGKRKL